MTGQIASKAAAFSLFGILTISLGNAHGAAAAAQPTTHTVILEANGNNARYQTQAVTVADFLRERGIAARPVDWVRPAPETQLSDDLRIEYRAAVTVTITGHLLKRTVWSAAPDVGALLEEERVAMGPYDEVSPGYAAPLKERLVVRVTRVHAWTKTTRRTVLAVQHRKDATLPVGTSHVVRKGAPEVREIVFRFVQRESGPARKSVIATIIVRPGMARIVREGTSQYVSLMDLARFGAAGTAKLVGGAFTMLATAYTANCYGCSGRTALGMAAGHGIVAVDPRVIPLGSRLFIAGYGYAVAGDTGGAIVGNRIDLGFDSQAAAIQFGRRAVTVYRVR